MVLDGHIHMMGDAKPIDLSQKLARAGVDGGIILSRPPIGFEHGADFKKSTADALELCGKVKNCYPFFWIDPLSEKAVSEVDEAVNLGFAGFKIITTQAMPEEKRAMAVYRRIAHHNKPVLFHSGILWNKGNNSNYNRPANFECLIEVEGLRFALAHISWPWCDECIAVYGKMQQVGRGIEMFVDITPGTPEIYRKDALYRLLFAGYFIENNVIFGTDCLANDYDSGWAASWIAKDREIYQQFSVTKAVQEKIFEKNILRFIHGK